jgi:hypothetical protein
MITLVQWTNEARRGCPSIGFGLRFARELAWGDAFRAPHHTVSTIGLVGELAVAVGGVLYLEGFECFRASAVRTMFDVWGRMDEDLRPDVVMVARTGYAPDLRDHSEDAGKWRALPISLDVFEAIPHLDSHVLLGDFGPHTLTPSMRRTAKALEV